REITQTRRNVRYLKGIPLPKELTASDDPQRVLHRAQEVYLSVPSQSLRENLRRLGPLIPQQAIVVSLMKGIERGTAKRMSEVIVEELQLDPARVAVVSGPNLALEIAKEQPTAAVVASSSLETATRIATTVTNHYFRSYVNTDVVGTEF